MTATTEDPIRTVFLWVGAPDVGTEHLLMVLVDDPNSPDATIYRPLMAVDQDTAHSLADVAQQAATGLGVTAVLRVYEIRAVAGEPIALAKVTP